MILGWGTNIPHAAQCSQKQRKRKRTLSNPRNASCVSLLLLGGSHYPFFCFSTGPPGKSHHYPFFNNHTLAFLHSPKLSSYRRLKEFEARKLEAFITLKSQESGLQPVHILSPDFFSRLLITCEIGMSIHYLVTYQREEGGQSRLCSQKFKFQGDTRSLQIRESLLCHTKGSHKPEHLRVV